MVTINKRILLLTKSEEAFLLIKKQIEDLFPNYIEICKLSTYEPENHYDLVVSTYRHEGLVEFPSEKTIIANRTIPVSFLSELLSMPDSTICYVASNTFEASLESIKMLQGYGIQFDMLPYPSNENELSSTITTVITHHPDLIRTDIFSKVILIGIRPLDFSTMVEIAVRLQLPISTTNIYKATNMHEIVRLNQNLSQTISQLRNVYFQMESIINTSQDGIVTINSDGTIIQVNKALEEYIASEPNHTVIRGKSFSNVFPSFDLFKNKENYLYTINGLRFVVQQLPITLTDGEIGTLIIFREISKLQQTEHEVRRKTHALGFHSRYQFSQIIGHSSILKETIDKSARLGLVEQPILIFGENGTGKELFAHSLHHVSKRSNQPFVPINFAGLPSTLAESELFGYEEGAFTGAKKGGKPGFFELAHNGTIFLDEIGDASPAIQASLLRVLQEKQILRVGGTKLIPINVRIIAATNKDLGTLVEKGEFREDLFYRLNVLPLNIPPLRERKEDILPLMESFFSKSITFEKDVIKQLLRYPWPGNVRELENTVYYLAAIMKDDIVKMSDLPDRILHLSNDIHNNPIVEKLQIEGSLIEFFAILSYLYSANLHNWNTGRKAMEAYFQEECTTPLSVQQIKSRMTILKKYRLVEIGTTRQGSWLTELGIETMKRMKRQLG